MNSPSRLHLGTYGCPALLHHYDEQGERRRAGEKSPEPLSVPAELGTSFHRCVEAAQVAIADGMDPDAATEAVIKAEAPALEVVDKLRIWAASPMAQPEALIGLEMAIAIDDDHNLCDYHGPHYLRMRIDRVDWVEEGDRRVVRVIDYKSGWSGWRYPQREAYVLGVAAWLDAQFPDFADVDTIIAGVWSPTHPNSLSEVERYDLRNLEKPARIVAECVEQAERVARQPRERRRLGGYCVYCPIRSSCPAYATVEPMDPIGERDVEAARDAAARLEALKVLTKETEAAVYEWFGKTGARLDIGGGKEAGFIEVDKTEVDAAPILAEWLSGYAGQIAEADEEGAARILREIAIAVEGATPPTRAQLLKLCKVIRSDRSEAETLLEAHTRVMGASKRWQVRGAK